MTVKHGLGLAQVLMNYAWLLENICKKEAFIVKTEMAYYAHTNKTEKVLQPELFRLNGITLKEKLENLLIRLEGKYASSSLTVANLPTNTEVIATKPQYMTTEAIDKLKGRTQETQNEMHVIWQSLN